MAGPLWNAWQQVLVLQVLRDDHNKQISLSQSVWHATRTPHCSMTLSAEYIDRIWSPLLVIVKPPFEWNILGRNKTNSKNPKGMKKENKKHWNWVWHSSTTTYQIITSTVPIFVTTNQLCLRISLIIDRGPCLFFLFIIFSHRYKQNS